MNINWNPPTSWRQIDVVDMHTGGEPLRIPISGLPSIHGNNVLEKRNFFKNNLDHLRTGLMFEPRGHADMYGAIISDSSTEDADFDVFFIHNEGYSTMCGHAIIALTKFAYESGLVNGEKEELIINVPAGRISARAKFDGDLVVESSFNNVPSYLLIRDELVQVEGIGEVRFDVAFGGAYYAIVEASDIGIGLTEESYYELIDMGRKIKQAVSTNFEVNHPVEQDLSFLYGTIFTGKAVDPKHHSRNVCIFAEGEVDRSATGSGVSARAGLHFVKGELQKNQAIVIESIIGSTMTVEVMDIVDYHGFEAVLPKVSGKAWFTGKSTYCFDPTDPYNHGFIFR